MIDVSKIKRMKIPYIQVLIIIMAVGFTLFFTSQMWYLESDTTVKPTEYYHMITENERDIQLCAWNYSPSQKQMEIELSVMNNSLDGQNTYEFSAFDRKKGELAVKKVMETTDLIVLHIMDVPSRWNNISLRMELPKTKNAEEKTVRIYGNRDSIHIVDAIEIKTEKEYRSLRIEATIAAYEKIIRELKDRNAEIGEQIINYENSIPELKGRLAYQTEQEQEETNRLIIQAEGNITLAMEEQEKIQTEILEYQDRIAYAEKQMEELMANQE